MKWLIDLILFSLVRCVLHIAFGTQKIMYNGD